MISTLCSTRFSMRKGHTVATSLVDRLRHDWRCEEAAEVGGYGRCMITFQATLVSVRSAWAARCRAHDAQRENRRGGARKAL